ncbi:MAG: ArsB/NhaD family transporter [Nitrospirae bacterium]|nr:ArsB/NhaD family transporter [Nitrospirota bacterium]
MAFWIVTMVFIAAYVLIATEKIHKTVVALCAAALLLALKTISQREAFHLEEFGIDWNVIFLLISMMVIINIMRPTGIFEFIAIKCVKIAKGEPVRILVLFVVITAVLSALLDNVTTVLFIVPITIYITSMLEVDASVFLICEALASNIGGTATLIGDPPNIMIASRAKLGFIDFIYNLSPIVIILMLVFIVIIRLFFAKRLKTTDECREKVLSMRENEAIKDAAELKKSLTVLMFVIIGFTFHGLLHLEPATIALLGASVLLVLTREKDVHKIFAEVEWSTIFFFIGIFILVGATVKAGLVRMMSEKMLSITDGHFFFISMLMLWFSAVVSAIVDNIPYIATMNPLVIDMAERLWPNLSGTALLHAKDLLPIWWSLALGACLGGNATPIGASANVIVIGLGERAGIKISFLKFTAFGLPLTFLTILISSLYVWIRYYLLN